MTKNRYWKSLLGIFADALIAKAVDYAGTGTSTVATDFKSFVANAAEGEVGVFDADTNLLISGVPVSTVIAPIPATQRVFVAMKRDGLIERTLSFRPSDYNLKRVAYAAAVAEVATATFAGAPVTGNTYRINVIETTPGYQPFPTWSYAAVAKTGDTLASVLTKIVNQMNDGTNVINKDTSPIVTASSNGTVVTMTAINAGVSFRLSFSLDSINDLGVVGAVTAPPFYGNGTYVQVAELEFETNVYKGITTQYPDQGANPADYGTPTSFAANGNQYSCYIFIGIKTERSPTPVEQHFQPHNIILAIPSNGSANADAEIKALFGL